MIAYGYVRINKQRTKPKDLGLKKQHTMIKEFASENKMQLKKIISDEENTSSSLQIPGMKKILDLAENGEIDVLIVARLDRITRAIRQLNQFIQKLCTDYKVRFISLEEGIDSAKESGELVLNVIKIITKWDNKMISDRTKELIEKKREMGERVGHAPFGYVYQNKKLVAFSPELKIVNIIHQKRGEEALSYHKIAHFLNERKIPSKRGGRWYAETVKTIFENPLYRKNA